MGKSVSRTGELVDDPRHQYSIRLSEEEEQILNEIMEKYPGISRSLIIRPIIRQFKRHRVPLFDK